jgi:hypothetical protein
MSDVRELVLATNLDGRLEMVATVARDPAQSDAMWRRWQTLESSSLQGWAPRNSWQSLGTPGGAGQLEAAVAQNHDGRLELVVASFDTGVWHASQRRPGRHWTELKPLAGTNEGIRFSRAPALARNLGGRLELFVPASDGAVWHCWQSQAGSNAWSPWSSLGTPRDEAAVNDVVVAPNQDGRLELFADTDDEIWHRFQPRPDHGPWSPWSSLESSEEDFEFLGRPVVAQNQDGRLELFVLGRDGVVWHCWQAGSGSDSWTRWSSLDKPAGTTGQLAVGAYGDGRLVVFITVPPPEGTNSTLAWREQTIPSGGPWSPWTPFELGSFPVLSPAAAIGDDGLLQLWYPIVGTTDLYVLRQSAGSPGEIGWDAHALALDPPVEPEQPGYVPRPAGSMHDPA